MKYSGAVAVVEVAGLPTAVACADAMVKAANVTLIGYEITKGGPGMVNVKICGDVGAVQAAVDAGCAVANQITRVMSRVIMPRPHADLEKMLLDRNKEAFFSRNFDTETQPSPEPDQASSQVNDGDAAAKTDIEVEEPKEIKPETNGQDEVITKDESKAGKPPEAKPEIKTEENIAREDSRNAEQPKATGEPKKADQPKGAEETKAKEQQKPKEDTKSNTVSSVHKKNPKDNPRKK